MSGTIDYAGDPHIGVFSRVINDIVVVPPDAPETFVATLREEMGVDPVVTTIQDSSLIGPLLTGNSRGMVVSGMVTDREREILQEYGELLLLAGPTTASGNIILATDTFVALHPEVDSRQAEEIEDFLKVKVIRLTLGGIKTVGMAAAATNRGILVHPRATNQELELLETASGLPVGRGSVNLGSGLIGTGLVVNKNGYLAGFQTSGFELGRIEEVFGFME
ncbi:MAG: translation initiation factor IF-6 [Methanomicrobiales archaeon]|nr:translation initiation factor IF-6 [Methanomicrobiales archaeon]